VPWTFHLNVTNGTDRDLKVIGSTIPWGYWYRDNVRDRGPMTIPKGKSVQALGVAAKSGPEGYEFSCSWADDTPAGKLSYGTVSIYIDVPYIAGNSSRCEASGALFIDGWDALPRSDHNFVRSITITTHAPRTVEGPILQAAAEENEDDKLYRDYLLAVRENNPDVRDWASVESILAETSGFNPTEQMPKEPRYPPVKMLVARSAPEDIAPGLWAGVGDPDYPNAYSKQVFVKRYFSVAVYSVNTNPRDVINLARGEKRKFGKRVQITSSIRNVQETTWSLKTSLETKSESVPMMKEVAAKLEWQYGVKNVLEESRTMVSEEVEERLFTAPPDHDVEIVPWVFSTIVLVYRVGDDQKVSLIAASDWAQQQLCKTYEY
jgi:hypothetical protein